MVDVQFGMEWRREKGTKREGDMRMMKEWGASYICVYIHTYVDMTGNASYILLTKEGKGRGAMT